MVIDLEPELESAVQELECQMRPTAGESETGRGAATALLQLLGAIENASGLTTPSQQQAALRVGQAQVTAGGDPVRHRVVPGFVRPGTLNKPDVSYVYQTQTPQGAALLRRMNIEIDTNPAESRRHQAVVNARDRQARNLFVVVDPWTGQVRSARVREPGTRRTAPIPQNLLAGLLQGLPRAVPPPLPGRPGRPAPARRARPRRELELPLERELEFAAAELESGAESFITQIQSRFPWAPGYSEGHEELTRQAASGLPVDLAALIRGVRQPDVGSGSVGDVARSVAHVSDPLEQKRHSLRRMGTNLPVALSEIRNQFLALYGSALAAPTRSRAFEWIGQALHLLQDSYSEAHTQRRWRSGPGGSHPIAYVRAYYLGPRPPFRTRGTTEHNSPTDDRDEIWAAPRTLKFNAQIAVNASNEFLQLMLRHLGTPATPAKGAEVRRFMDWHLA